MIHKPELISDLEKEFMKNEGKLTYEQSVRLFTHMWNEAVTLGVLPLKDPLEGIEVDIKIAKVLNSCSKKSCPG